MLGQLSILIKSTDVKDRLMVHILDSGNLTEQSLLLKYFVNQMATSLGKIGQHALKVKLHISTVKIFMNILDIVCTPDAPVIPTDSEYTLDKDDGYVIVNSIEYPSLTRTENLKLLSTFNNVDIAKNYMANLTYHCGSAREFFNEDGSRSSSQSMTCQWDKTWTHQLG